MAHLGHSPDLPFDIFHSLVDTLVRSHDFATLKHLSLTCKDLRSLCLRHLFAQIRITDDEPNDLRSDTLPLNQVAKLLERNPDLAKYIKHLEVYIQRFELENANFPIVLDRLHGMTSLLIDGTPLYLFNELAKVPETLQISIERLIRVAHLRHLELVNVDNIPLPWILAASTSLESLVLSNVSPPTTLGQTLPIALRSNDPVPELRSFSIAGTSMNIGKTLAVAKRPDGLPVISLKSLEKLALKTLQLCCSDEVELMKIYLGIPIGLRDLSLHVIQIDDPVPIQFVKYIHPSSLRTLQHLKLRIVINTEEDTDPYFFAYDELLKLASTGCPLQTLRIEITFWRHDDSDFFMHPRVWSKLDVRALEESFSALSKVTLDVGFGALTTQSLAHEPARRLNELVKQLRPVLKDAFGSVQEKETRINFWFSVHSNLQIIRENSM